MKKEEERMKKEGVSASQIEATKRYHLAEYAKQGGIGTDANKYQNIALEDLADYQSYSEFMNTYGKDIEAELSKYGTVSYGQDGQVIVKKTGSNESVDTKTVQDVLKGFAQGDDKLLHYLNQGVKMGYTSGKGMDAAFNAAVEKYDYTRTDNATDWDVNSNWGRMLDEKEKYGNVITGTDVKNTGAPAKVDWAGRTIVPGYKEEVKTKQQNLQSIDSEIARHQQTLTPGSGASAHSIASAQQAIKGLQNQKQQLAAEIDTDNQIVNSITESTIKQIFPNSTADGQSIKVNADNVLNAKNQYEDYKKRVHPSEINTNPTLLAYKKYYEDAVNGFGKNTGVFDDLKYKNSTTEEKAKAALDLSKQLTENVDKNIQSYHENKVTYTPTLQIVDGKNPEATKIKAHVIGNPNQYNFKRLVNGKMVDYNPSAGAINSGWLSPNAKTTTELVNIVADGKNTSQYVVKDASGKVIETYYASPKNPESVAAVYNNYYDKVGPNGLFFKESTNNPDLHNKLLKKTNQLAQTFLSSSTDKDITSEHTFENGTKAIFDVDGATAGSYNLTLYDKAGNVVPMQLPDGTITDFTTTDYTNLFLILNEFEKQQ
jgi:hypothetical protein